MNSNSKEHCSELEKLQKLVMEHEDNQDYLTAMSVQNKIVQMVESDSRCSSGELGDSFYRVGYIAYRAGAHEEAVGYLCKALGFRRLFFGKGHPKVIEVMDLIREIRNNTPKKSSGKVDRRTAEYRRSACSVS